MRFRTGLMLLALLLAATALLLGCGPRLSPGQAQALAEARVGAVAAQEQRQAVAQAEDPAEAARLTQELLDNLGRGALGFTLAATANLDLPEPSFASAALALPEHAHAYAEAGAEAAAHPPKGWKAEGIAAMLLAASGALGVLLKLGRNIPGVGGTVAALLSPIWDHLVPTKVRDKEEAVDASLDIAIAYGERLAHALTNAGFGHIVEDAKLRARFLSEKLGVTEEVKRRLDLVRNGVVTLPPLPADTRPIKPEPPPA